MPGRNVSCHAMQGLHQAAACFAQNTPAYSNPPHPPEPLAVCGLDCPEADGVTTAPPAAPSPALLMELRGRARMPGCWLSPASAGLMLLRGGVSGAVGAGSRIPVRASTEGPLYGSSASGPRASAAHGAAGRLGRLGRQGWASSMPTAAAGPPPLEQVLGRRVSILGSLSPGRLSSANVSISGLPSGSGAGLPPSSSAGAAAALRRSQPLWGRSARKASTASTTAAGRAGGG